MQTPVEATKPVSAVTLQVLKTLQATAGNEEQARLALEHLIKHPQATYSMTVRGESMREAGIFDGDVLLVDRAIKPSHGQIVVAVVDGDFTCKQLWQRGGRLKLKAANPTFADIVPTEGQTVEVWGVVIAAIKQFKR